MRRFSTHLLVAASAALVLSACPDNDKDEGDDDASVARDATPLPDATSPDAGPGGDDAALPDAVAPDAEPRDADAPLDAQPIPVAIAYSANAESLGIQELYFTDTSTSRMKVNPVMAGGPFGGKKMPETGGLQYFTWSFDGSSLLYEAQQDTYDFREIYMARRGGARLGAPVKISLPNAVNETGGFNVGPDRYLELDQIPAGTTSSRMYIIDTSSVAPVPMPVDQGSVVFWLWSPVSPWIAIWDIIQSMNDRDLWLVDLSTGPNFVRERINPGANLGFGSAAAWSPDGRRIVYSADETALRLFELFYAELSGGALGPRQRLHPPFSGNQDIDVSLSGVAFSPDGTKLAYRADLAADEVKELFIIDMSGAMPGMPAVASGPQLSGEGVMRMSFSPDSARVVYAADPNLPNTTELFVTTFGGAAGPQPVHFPVPMGTQMVNELWARGGELLIYGVFNLDFTQMKLWVSDVRASPLGAPIELSPQLAAEETASLFDVSPDGRTLMYRTDNYSAGRTAFYLVDLSTDPPGAPVRLSEGKLGAVWCWAPDNRLAVVSDREKAGTGELFLVRDVSVPGDLVRISGPIIDGGSVFGCAFPPR